MFTLTNKKKENNKMKIKENDIVTFKDDNGDKLKGKVVLVFTSLQGNRCVHINNFATTRLIKDITKL
jgi:hypothetical protein